MSTSNPLKQAACLLDLQVYLLMLHCLPGRTSFLPKLIFSISLPASHQWLHRCMILAEALPPLDCENKDTYARTNITIKWFHNNFKTSRKYSIHLLRLSCRQYPMQYRPNCWHHSLTHESSTRCTCRIPRPSLRRRFISTATSFICTATSRNRLRSTSLSWSGTTRFLAHENRLFIDFDGKDGWPPYFRGCYPKFPMNGIDVSELFFP